MKQRSKKPWHPPLPCGWQLGVQSSLWTTRKKIQFFDKKPQCCYYIAAQWFWLEELCHRKVTKLFRRSDKLSQGITYKRGMTVQECRTLHYDELYRLEAAERFLGEQANRFHRNACRWMRLVDKKIMKVVRP
jgi:hypothetical protein